MCTKAGQNEHTEKLCEQKNCTQTRGTKITLRRKDCTKIICTMFIYKKGENNHKHTK